MDMEEKTRQMKLKMNKYKHGVGSDSRLEQDYHKVKTCPNVDASVSTSGSHIKAYTMHLQLDLLKVRQKFGHIPLWLSSLTQQMRSENLLLLPSFTFSLTLCVLRLSAANYTHCTWQRAPPTPCKWVIGKETVTFFLWGEGRPCALDQMLPWPTAQVDHVSSNHH